MKKLYLFIICAFLVQASVFPQSCLPEGITFTSQAQIDSFAINNPGCTEIEGDVIIAGNDITSLNGLNVLVSVRGYLSVENNDALTSLAGLEGLTSIEGNLQIYNNDVLTSLAGLDNVTSVGGTLYVRLNPALTSLAGLNNVTSLEGGLQIRDNQSLTSLAGLDNVSSIGLALKVINNDALTSLAGLEGLTSIEAFIHIFFNEALTSLTGLEGLTAIKGNLDIQYNDTLTSLAGLDNLTSIGGLIIKYNDLLISLQGLENLDSIGGNFDINSNSSVTSLTGLENLTTIGGDFYIDGNNALTSLTGLENLASIGGAVDISGNNALINMSGLDNLTSIGGELIINLNTVLNNLSGLGNLTSIGEGFGIGGNDALISLSGLDNLTFIGGGLIIGNWLIGGNPALSSLSGLESLTSIGGELVISYNYDLNSLIGLDNIDAASITNLFILNNSSLSTCDVQSICNYLASPGGSVYIHDNAPGCNSPGEVEEACLSHCLPEGITFSTQAQIDSFATNYPNCTEIEGSLTIDGSDITRLNGLNVVTSIGGNMTIYTSSSLTNFAGMDNLNFIGGNLNILHSNALISLTGLEGLESIGGEIYIYNNDALISISGLENLNSLNDLTIAGNTSLSICNEQWLCDYLANPNGTISIGGNASGCNSIIELANACGGTFPCLPYGNYYLISQAEIDNFQTVFPNCTNLEGDVGINGSDIVNLNGLNVVTSIGGNLRISDNDALTSLAGLEGLTSVEGDLVINFNEVLTSLAGLDNVTSIEGTLGVARNPELINLLGLEGVTSVGGDIGISENDALNNLLGLDNITNAGGLSITDSYINSLVGLNNLDSVFGNVDITWNDSLINLSGLDSLNFIGGHLRIYKNDVLKSYTGLGNLTTITDDLSIGDCFSSPPFYNTSLINISALQNLKRVGQLYIENNMALTSLSGLENIDANSIQKILVYNNWSLSECDVKLICDYLAIPNGDVYIQVNNSGCNSEQEVEEACASFVSESEGDHGISMYPNPATNELFIVCNNGIRLTEVSIYNQMGQKVFHTNENTENIDISKLPNGLYVIELITEKSKIHLKLIVE